MGEVLLRLPQPNGKHEWTKMMRICARAPIKKNVKHMPHTHTHWCTYRIEMWWFLGYTIFSVLISCSFWEWKKEFFHIKWNFFTAIRLALLRFASIVGACFSFFFLLSVINSDGHSHKLSLKWILNYDFLRKIKYKWIK